MLCRLLCSALRAHVHRCDIAADGSPDGAAYAAAHGRAYSCTYGGTDCGANSITECFTDGGANCQAY